MRQGQHIQQAQCHNNLKDHENVLILISFKIKNFILAESHCGLYSQAPKEISSPKDWALLMLSIMGFIIQIKLLLTTMWNTFH